MDMVEEPVDGVTAAMHTDAFEEHIETSFQMKDPSGAAAVQNML